MSAILVGKTLSLLKEGVKTLSQRLNNSTEIDSIDLLSPQVLSSCKSKHEHNSKQMVLNSKLQLLGVDKAIQVSVLLGFYFTTLFFHEHFIMLQN